MLCLTIARLGMYQSFRFLHGGIGDAAAVSNAEGAVWKLFLISFLRVLMPVFMRFLAFCFWIFAVSTSDARGVAATTENTDSADYAEVLPRVS